MKILKLKSKVNFCVHELYSLEPLSENHDATEEVYKFKTDYHTEFIRDEERQIIGIVFSYGPVLYVGQTNPQLNMKLKDICPAYNKDGEFVYTTLIFEK